MKKNKILKHMISLLFSVGAISLITSHSSYDSLAVKITPYTLIGTNPEGVDENSPPAYVISGSPYFPDGTILYKQYFKNREITYYSPKPPKGSVEATDSKYSKDYVDWGFWDFALNKETKDREFKSWFYYPTVTLNEDVVATIPKSNGLPTTSSVTLKKDAVLNVYSITREASGTIYVYFDAKSAKVTDSKNGVARVPYSKVTPNGTRKNIYFNEYFDTKTTYTTDSGETALCNTFYHNFKPYRQVDEGYLGVGHNRITDSDLVAVPSSVKTCSLGGKEGEWRYLGLSSAGNPIANPYFASDWLSFMGNANMKYYDWSSNPWANSSEFITMYGTSTTFFDEHMKTEKENILNTIMSSYAPYKIGWDSGTLTLTEFSNRISLLTNPTDETALFAGARNTGGVTRQFAIKTPSAIKDLYVAKVTVKDDKGNIVAQGTRSTPTSSFKKNTAYNGTIYKDNYYTVEVVLGNGSNNPLNATTLKAIAGTSVGKDLNQDTSIGETTALTPDSSLSNKGNLTAKKGSLSNPFVYPLKLSSSHNYDYIDIYGFVSPDHAGLDNRNFDNDTGGIRVPVTSAENKGDLVVDSIELINSKTGEVDYKINANNTVSIKNAIVPGNGYKIRYNVTYTGETMYIKTWDKGKWVYDTNWQDNPNAVKKYTIPVTFSVLRKVGATVSSDSKTDTQNLKTSDGSNSIPMVNGIKMSYTTPAYMFQHPYLETSFKIATTNNIINKSTSNDSLSTTLNDNFDISASEIKINPSIEYVEDTTRKIDYTIVYNANLKVPSYVNSDYQAYVQTIISINGQNYFVYDHLKIGANNNITHTISNVPISVGAIDVSVTLNSDLAVYETGNYSNNTTKASSKVQAVKNPFLGNPEDKAGVTYNGTVTGTNKGGSANNNCLLPRTINKYTATYNILKWTATDASFTTFNKNNNITFKKYSTLSDVKSSLVENTETFVIKDVLFKSKYTTDKKLGTDKDGWVSMTKTNDSIIKSGYGFELKIVVEYKTNALLNNPSPSNNGNSGTIVSNLASDISIIPDIFVELPGSKTATSDTRTILSTTGYSGTTKGIDVNRTKNKVVIDGMEVSEWEYTIKPYTTNGKVSQKIFIPGELKNGSYKVSIYTPPVTGVSSFDETSQLQYGALCDRKDVYVHVNGSATDDLNSHITQ